MPRTHLCTGKLRLVPVALLPLLAGCGGGHSLSLNNPSGPAATSRQLIKARFDVDVTTGKVKVTSVQDSRAAKQHGRAIFNAAAISFSSSDLISVGGDSGQRVLTMTATNNTGQTLPPTLRVVVGNLANTLAGSNTKANTVTSTLAGTGTTGLTDGDGTAAAFLGPVNVTAGSGPNANTFFVADGNTIRQVQPNGQVTTVAGASASGNTDGTGLAARFNAPYQMAADALGNLFIADASNFIIRRMTPQGVVNTIAGTGTTGHADGAGNVATFGLPYGIAVSSDGTRIYVSDNASHSIRLVQFTGTDPTKSTSYTVSTVAGTNGTSGSADGTGTSATFKNPANLALGLDASGNEVIFVADRGNDIIRRVDSPAVTNGGVVTTIAGTAGTAGTADGLGGAATFTNVFGMTYTALPSGGFALFTTDCVNGSGSQLIRMILYANPNNPNDVKSSYNVVTVAGAGIGLADGTGTGTFDYALGVLAIPGGASTTLLVADDLNYKLRKVSVPAVTHSGNNNSNVTELVRLVNWDSETPNTSGATASWAKSLSPATTGSGYAGTLQFYVPSGVTGFSFTAYAEADTNLVNLPAMNASYLTTLAGDGGAGSRIGPGKLAEFSAPYGVAAVPPGLQSSYSVATRAFVADTSNARIRYIDVNGNVGTFAGSTSGAGASQFSGPKGVAVAPDGSVWVADTGNTRVIRLTTAGVASTISSAVGTPVGITVDLGGTVFVTDSVGLKIYKIEYISGDVTLAASYSVTNPVTGLTAPDGIVADTDGNVYFVDAGATHAVKMMTAGGTVTTVISTGLNTPSGITVDPAHNLYVSDAATHQVFRVNLQVSPATLTTLMGSGSGSANGPNGTFNTPHHVAMEAGGSVLVADTNNRMIRVLQRIVGTSDPPSQ